MAKETQDKDAIVSHPAGYNPITDPGVYREVASAVNNGAFAVILVLAVVIWYTKSFFRRAVDSYGELMLTLKKSVENNSKAIDRMADSQTRMVDILSDFKHSPYGMRIISELERQARELNELNNSK
jgi:hypothetical protein